jgi:hypothetical protein
MQPFVTAKLNVSGVSLSAVKECGPPLHHVAQILGQFVRNPLQRLFCL